MADPEGRLQMPAAFFEGIVHEYVHATGVQSREETYGIKWIKSGHTGHFESLTLPVSFFPLFNEGLTMLIEDGVSQAYLTQSPLSYPDGRILTVNTFKQLRERYIRGGGYAEAKSFVRGLIEHIAQSVKIQPDTVENALIRAYYDGRSGFYSKKGRELLEETVGKDFYLALQNAKTAEHIHNMISEFKLPPIDQETAEKLKSICAE